MDATQVVVPPQATAIFDIEDDDEIQQPVSVIVVFQIKQCYISPPSQSHSDSELTVAR